VPRGPAGVTALGGLPQRQAAKHVVSNESRRRDACACHARNHLKHGIHSLKRRRTRRYEGKRASGGAVTKRWRVPWPLETEMAAQKTYGHDGRVWPRPPCQAGPCTPLESSLAKRSQTLNHQFISRPRWNFVSVQRRKVVTGRGSGRGAPRPYGRQRTGPDPPALRRGRPGSPFGGGTAVSCGTRGFNTPFLSTFASRRAAQIHERAAQREQSCLVPLWSPATQGRGCPADGQA